mmetsp:Transcript_44768/g.32786  ORF Transcript_44768/g.32786 Transcript_44768/m.32786 type:complete len:123 (-) Transcript_44768:62-430(-)
MAYGTSSDDLQDIYNQANVFGKNFWNGMKMIFRGGNRIDEKYRASLVLRNFADEVQQAIKKLYKKSGGLFEKNEWKEYDECIGKIKEKEITEEILAALDSANDAFIRKDYAAVGLIFGQIDT